MKYTRTHTLQKVLLLLFNYNVLVLSAAAGSRKYLLNMRIWFLCSFILAVGRAKWNVHKQVVTGRSLLVDR